MKRLIIFIAALATLSFRAGNAAAQQQWTLQQCIEYAIENNISVQQMILRNQSQEIRLNTAKNSRLPDLNANLGGNSYFGRALSRDNVYIDRTQISGSGSLSTSIPVFSGFSIKNTIAARELDLAASLRDTERTRDDVALNVTSLYMQVLFNKEILKVSESQVALSREQLRRSEILFENGKSPESEVYESKALVARDELTLTQSKSNLELSLLYLFQALNMEEYDNMDVRIPKLEDIDVMTMNSIKSPDNIYAYAVKTRPGILAEQTRLESVNKYLSVVKSSRYPSVSLSGGYSNSAYHTFSNGVVNKGLGDQLSANGSQSVGLSIRVPIFNRLSTRNSINSARIDIKNQELTLISARQSLYKDIEQSYHNATAAFDKYLSAVKSVEAARIAFSYAEQRSEAGRSTIFDFNDAKTRLERSESEAIQAKFEFLFRTKILDFYAGNALEFQAYY